jgi:DNA modification methylase
MASPAPMSSPNIKPNFVVGEAICALSAMPRASVDCIVTSPPYWGKREYENGGIGLENKHTSYVEALAKIVDACEGVLKPTGSLWLNIGDTYKGKHLLGIPWRVAFELTDNRGWILRNSIVWNKVKSGMDNSRDRLGNRHEMIFHFVRQPKYFYDADAIRTKPREAKVVNGSVVSATGVSGVRYKRQIELSTELTPQEKTAALSALNETLDRIRLGELSDFRMVIRGQQRATHSDSTKLSGRAKELVNKGYYFLRYHPKGSKPTDVWDILPEDTQKREHHFAAYPEDLCRIPILATCPANGIVLDPFCGTGTTMKVAEELGRGSIGIDISAKYIEMAKQRCGIQV